MHYTYLLCQQKPFFCNKSFHCIKLILAVSGSEENACGDDIAASWSTTVTPAATTLATETHSGKSTVTRSQGTVAALPSIGVTPSSPDVARMPSGRVQQSSVLQDQSVQPTLSENDVRVCLPADYTAVISSHTQIPVNRSWGIISGTQFSHVKRGKFLIASNVLCMGCFLW